MPLRVEDIRDIEVAKQVAQLAIAENARLHERLSTLLQELAEARGESNSKALQQELFALQEQMASLQRKLFAASSERRPRDGGDKERKKPEPPTGPREQKKLPHVEDVHELVGDERKCGCCGLEMVLWDGQDEETEEVDVVERKFVLKKHIRKKYRCKCGASPKLAPRPPTLPGGGRYSLAFAIGVVVAKWCDHLPLERQVRMMRREGLDVDSSTLWEQAERLARVLAPTYDAIRLHIAAKNVAHADETSWKMLKKGSKAHWVWSLSCADAAYYRVKDSRGHEVIVDMLDGFSGVLVVDGYGAYKAAKKKLGSKIKLAICWSHARRTLIEAEAAYPQAGEALDLIGEMFLIERDMPDWHAITDRVLRDKALEHIRDTRRKKTKPLIEALDAWVKAQQALPESSLGKAIGYFTEYADGLRVFLDEPRVPMSNNPAERSLRGPVVGRKNHLGSKSVRGTEVAALFYSLLESAKLAGVEPHAYLTAAATAALLGDATLLPHQMRAETRRAG